MTDVNKGLSSVSIIWMLIVICVLAVLANVVVLLVIACNKNFRGTTEVFMGNMAISDILLAGIALPVRLAQGLQVAGGDKNYVGGPAACKLSMFIPNFTIASSILTMVAISFDRYMMIIHNRKLGKMGLILTVVTIWVGSFGSSSPQFYEYALVTKKYGEGSSSMSASVEETYAPHNDRNRKNFPQSAENYGEELNESTHEQAYTYGPDDYYISCSAHKDVPENFELIYASTFVFALYFTPLFVIIINYMNIGRFLWKVSKATETSGSGTQSAVSKGKVRVVKMLSIVTAVFAVLWAPYFVLFTMEEITGTDDSAKASTLPHTIKQAAVVCSTISNPILYYIFNDRFKKAALGIVSCGRLHSGRVNDMEASATQQAVIEQ